MRNAEQSKQGEAHDLKHFQRAFDRASENTVRTPEQNKVVLHHLAALIQIFTNEKVGSAIALPENGDPANPANSARETA